MCIRDSSRGPQRPGQIPDADLRISADLHDAGQKCFVGDHGPGPVSYTHLDVYKRQKQYNKRTKISWNAECVRFTNELGIKIFGMFIVDLDFQKKDFDRLYTWIATRGVKNVAVSIFTPVPGTEIYHDYADKLITEDPGHWDYMHPVSYTHL